MEIILVLVYSLLTLNVIICIIVLKLILLGNAGET